MLEEASFREMMKEVASLGQDEQPDKVGLGKTACPAKEFGTPGWPSPLSI